VEQTELLRDFLDWQPRTGRPTKILDLLGREYDAHYEVRDLDALRADPALARTDVSTEQIAKANEADAHDYKPDLVLQISPNPYIGPPVIAPDGTILSGHRRSAVVGMLRDQGRFALYGNRLKDAAELAEIPAESVVPHRTPVLVRVVDTPMSSGERQEFARMSNLTPDDWDRTFEQVREDAPRFGPLLSELQIQPGETLEAALANGETNGAAMRRFYDTLDLTEVEGMFVDGELTQDALKRMQLVAAGSVLTDPELLFRLSQGV